MAKKKVVAKKAVKKATAKVTPEEFCAQWKKASDKKQTIDDLAKTLNMSKANIQARKANYQSTLGLKFPKLERVKNGPRLDKATLQGLLNGHPL